MNILFFILKTKLLLKRVFGKETEMRTLLGTMNEEIEKMKKAVNIDYAPVTLDKSDKKVGLSFLYSLCLERNKPLIISIISIRFVLSAK